MLQHNETLLAATVGGLIEHECLLSENATVKLQPLLKILMIYRSKFISSFYGFSDG